MSLTLRVAAATASDGIEKTPPASPAAVKRFADTPSQRRARQAGNILPAQRTSGMTRTELVDLIRFLSSMRGNQ